MLLLNHFLMCVPAMSLNIASKVTDVYILLSVKIQNDLISATLKKNKPQIYVRSSFFFFLQDIWSLVNHLLIPPKEPKNNSCGILHSSIQSLLEIHHQAWGLHPSEIVSLVRFSCTTLAIAWVAVIAESTVMAPSFTKIVTAILFSMQQ